MEEASEKAVRERAAWLLSAAAAHILHALLYLTVHGNLCGARAWLSSAAELLEDARRELEKLQSR
uniref:Uncharacterized protein n=1 Tax=Thermofilum pendens TaxID=2269 RepID=A0A7J3X9H6_THEPE